MASTVRQSGVDVARGERRRCHTCPASMINASPTITVSARSSGTAAAPCIHQHASTNHDARLPAATGQVRRLAADSMKSAALRMASSNPSPHRAAGATSPPVSASISTMLATSTMPLPEAGSNGRPIHRVTSGAMRATSPNNVYTASAQPRRSGVRCLADQTASAAMTQKAATK